MSYNALAETFSVAARVLFFAGKPGISVPAGWSRFDQVYAEIADETPLDVPFRKSALVGKLPVLSEYAPKTQAEILHVVFRDMQSLPAEADGLVRVGAGWFRWRLAGGA